MHYFSMMIDKHEFAQSLIIWLMGAEVSKMAEKFF